MWLLGNPVLYRSNRFIIPIVDTRFKCNLQENNPIILSIKFFQNRSIKMRLGFFVAIFLLYFLTPKLFLWIAFESSYNDWCANDGKWVRDITVKPVLEYPGCYIFQYLCRRVLFDAIWGGCSNAGDVIFFNLTDEEGALFSTQFFKMWDFVKNFWWSFVEIKFF